MLGLMESLGNYIQYLLPTSLVMLIERYLILNSNKLKKVNVAVTHEIGLWLFVMYLTIVFADTVSPVFGFSFVQKGNVSIIPFKSIIIMFVETYRYGEVSKAVYAIIGAILLFVPLGFMLPLLWKKYQSSFKTICFSMELSIGIELIQLFLNHSTSADDVLLNILGAILGYGLFKAFYRVGRILPYTVKGITLYKKKELWQFRWEPELVIACVFLSTMGFGLWEYRVEQKNSKVQQLTSISQELNSDYLQASREQEESRVITICEDDLNHGPLISATEALLMQAEDGKVIFSKEGDKQIYPASTTKLLTALTALKYCSPDELVLIGDEITYIMPDSSRAGLYQGEMLTVEMLLKAMLLPSGNDAAYSLAAYVGQRVSEEHLETAEAICYFVSLMNDTAREVGACHSCFMTPDGYDQEGQFSTAYDLAIIAKECLNKQVIRDIVSKEDVHLYSVDGQEIILENSNELLSIDSPYYYEEAIGLKTGSTFLAGKCLVSAARFEEDIYIAVVMNASEEGRWEDSRQLLEYGRRMTYSSVNHSISMDAYVEN